MGNTESNCLIECIDNCDIQHLKVVLQSRHEELVSSRSVSKDCMKNWFMEIEKALHTVISMDIQHQPEYLQQWIIAIELFQQYHPKVWTSCDGNDIQWTGIHYACAHGNLIFLELLLMKRRSTSCIPSSRDVYGLHPIDYIASEHYLSTDWGLNNTRNPKTDFSIIEILRTSKAKSEAKEIMEYINNASFNKEGSLSLCLNMYYYLKFVESRCETSDSLTVEFRLPNISHIIQNGYFQVVWRADESSRTSEPIYKDNPIYLRDIQLCDQQGSSNTNSSQLEIIEGLLNIDAQDIPEFAIVHILFIACDENKLHRKVLLSTEGLLIEEELDSDDVSEADKSITSDSCTNEKLERGFSFTVGGETFYHPSRKLRGQSFSCIEDFHAHVKVVALQRACNQELLRFVTPASDNATGISIKPIDTVTISIKPTNLPISKNVFNPAA